MTDIVSIMKRTSLLLMAVILLLPVCLSASHIAYGSIRMEPVFLCMGQTCGMAASMAGSGAVQDVDVSRIQEIYAHNPCLDGKEKETLIDEDSPYIEGKEGWTVEKGREAYGESFLLYNGDSTGNRLVYRIPENLNGRYSVYAFQQKHGCTLTTFDIDAAGKKETVLFNRKDLHVEGQTRGEWVKLGDFRLKKNKGGSIRITSDEPGIHADGILFVKAR